jgi:hypothetical protein
MTDPDLRWQLRQLPREMDPARDLWPGIAARLQPAAARRTSRLAWTGGLALAASLIVAIVGWRIVSAPAAVSPGDVATLPTVIPAQAGSDPAKHVVQAEARALTVEYHATLAEYRTLPVPTEIQPGLDALDASARDIRSALAAEPDSVRLLQQLQRTYARRLELTHRAVAG